MKKCFLMMSLLLVSLGVYAQFEQGKWIVNPSITGMNFSYSQNEHARLGGSAQVGHFVADNIALMLTLGADWSRPVDEYVVGTGGRYYFDEIGLYLGSGLDCNRFRWSEGTTRTNWGLGIEAGYAFFLSRTVTIEPAAYYKWRFNDSDMSKFGMKIGFGFYF